MPVKYTHTIKPAQQLAALHIASGWSQKAAAEEAGVSEQTFSGSWMKNPAFVAKVNKEREAMLEATRDRMRSLGLQAMDALADVLKNAHRPADKLRAAEMVLQHIGFTDPKSGLWGWGVGKTTAEEVKEEEAKKKAAREMEKKQAKQFNELMADLVS